MWSGRQIISLCLPDICMVRRETGKEPLIIQRGRLVSGTLNKRHLGSSDGSILHVIAKDCPRGGRRLLDAVSDLQRLASAYLLRRGFSVGLDDVSASDGTQQRVTDMLEATYTQALRVERALADEVVRQGLEDDVGFVRRVHERREAAVTELMQRALVHAGAIISAELDGGDNAMFIMANHVGSKGSISNVAQMFGLVGQQLRSGQRPRAHAGRLFPTHRPMDQWGLGAPGTRGMVVNGFAQRMTPSEYYFHAMGSREGLTDTAVKTSDTGYFERRLMKALESYVLGSDGSVGSNGALAPMAKGSNFMRPQAIWGGDGFSGSALEHVSIQGLFCGLVDDGDAIVRQRFIAPAEDGDAAVAEELDRLKRLRTVLMPSLTHPYDHEVVGTVKVPVNVDRLLLRHMSDTDQDARRSVARCNDDMQSLLDQLDRLGQRLLAPQGPEGWAHLHVRAHVQIALCSRIASQLTQAQWDDVRDGILTAVEARLAPYGEAVGALSAHGIGEPTTQLTLNMFHYVGHGRNNMGIKSLTDIITLSKTSQRLGMLLPLRPDVDACTVRRTLVYTELGDVVSESIPCEADFAPGDIHPLAVEAVRMAEAMAAHMCPHRRTGTQGHSGGLVLRLDPVSLVRCNVTLAQVHGIIWNRLNGRGNDPRDVRALILADHEGPALVIVPVDMWGLLRHMFTKDGIAKHRDRPWTALGQTLLERLHINGLRGVTDVSVHSRRTVTALAGQDGQRPPQRQELLATVGSNLQAALGMDGFEWRQIRSNSLHDVHAVLGIQAMSMAIYYEMQQQLGANGKKVDDRYIALLADFMTYQGYPVAVARFDLNRLGTTGLLDKISFEQPILTVSNASAMGDAHRLTGVSSCVLLGTRMFLGTGCVHLEGPHVPRAKPPTVLRTPASPDYVPASPGYVPAWSPASPGAGQYHDAGFWPSSPGQFDLVDMPNW